MCEVIKSMKMTGNFMKDKSTANVENELGNEPYMENEEYDNEYHEGCFYGV